MKIVPISARAQRAWMYQLNPDRGDFEEGVPTTFENLMEELSKDEPVGPWYVTQGFREARRGDPLLIKIGGRKAYGGVALGHIVRIEEAEPRWHIWFEVNQVTDGLSMSPIPADWLKERIPKSQRNLVDISRQWPDIVEQLRRVGGEHFLNSRTGVRPFDPNRLAEVSESEKRDLLARCYEHCVEGGWTALEEHPEDFDLRATDCEGTRVFFDARSVPSGREKAEVAAGLARLLEARLFHGEPEDELWFITRDRLSPESRALLDSVGIATLPIDEAEEEGRDASSEVTNSQVAPLKIERRASLVVLETTEIGGLDEVLLRALHEFKAKLKPRTEWLVFSGTDQPHYRGLSTWIGFSESVPLELVDAFQAMLEGHGLSVEREMATPQTAGLRPAVRLSSEGLERLVPAPLRPDPNIREWVKTETVPYWVRAYQPF